METGMYPYIHMLSISVNSKFIGNYFNNFKECKLQFLKKAYVRWEKMKLVNIRKAFYQEQGGDGVILCRNFSLKLAKVSITIWENSIKKVIKEVHAYPLISKGSDLKIIAGYEVFSESI